MVNRRNRGSPPAACAGFTLVEAMVALLVLSVGVIGVAALHGQSLAASRAAIFRGQAINFASDMADRIRADRDAGQDLSAWQADIAATLPGGEGSVSIDTSSRPTTYTVSVLWDEGGAGGRASFPLTFELAPHRSAQP
ncbi:MAG: type IV pilus modification protein PilV [Gammaproteobacteria bacterium]|jgi:type IV pilus assembly protein PilV